MNVCLPSLQSELKRAVLSRQREYKMAAIHAKQTGDIDQAKKHYLTAKVTHPKTLMKGCDRNSPVVKMYLFIFEKAWENVVRFSL